MNTARGFAKAQRDIAVRIDDGVRRRFREVLSDDIRRAAILYGSQIAETPTQQFPVIDVRHGANSFNLHVGAYGELFDEEGRADEAAKCARSAVEHVIQDPLVAYFYSARSEVEAALQQLETILEISESIDLEIDRSACMVCEGLMELVQDDTRDQEPQWPV